MCGLVVFRRPAVRNAFGTIAVQWQRRGRAVLVDLQRETGHSKIPECRSRLCFNAGKYSFQLAQTSIQVLFVLTRRWFQFLEKDGNKRLGNRFSPHGDIQDHAFFKPIDWPALEARQLEPPFKPNLVSFKVRLFVG